MFETRFENMVHLQDEDMVCDLLATPHERGESSSHKRKRSPNEMNEITHVSSQGRRRVVVYNELGQPIGENAKKFKSFIGMTVRFHVSITYSNCPMVPKR